MRTVAFCVIKKENNIYYAFHEPFLNSHISMAYSVHVDGCIFSFYIIFTTQNV